MAKKKQSRDRWPELCELVKLDDNLPTRESGHWAEEKLFFWTRYLDIATTAMVGNPNWPNGLVYVDLFAGPGVCTIRESQKRIPGSPLIAANTPKPFSKILLVELDSANADACSQRMRQSKAASSFKIFEGDCNERVSDIIYEIPRGALTLAFIDPTGLHVHFQTIKKLSDRRADLLILFPDAVDVNRNIETYLPQPNSNLDLVLGPDSKWRDKWKELGSCDGLNTRRIFAKLYREQLRQLGYSSFGDKVISRRGNPLYRLVFASKDKTALKFWHEALKGDVRNQRQLPFD